MNGLRENATMENFQIFYKKVPEKVYRFESLRRTSNLLSVIIYDKNLFEECNFPKYILFKRKTSHTTAFSKINTHSFHVHPVYIESNKIPPLPHAVYIIYNNIYIHSKHLNFYDTSHKIRHHRLSVMGFIPFLL